MGQKDTVVFTSLEGIKIAEFRALRWFQFSVISTSNEEGQGDKPRPPEGVLAGKL